MTWSESGWLVCESTGSLSARQCGWTGDFPRLTVSSAMRCSRRTLTALLDVWGGYLKSKPFVPAAIVVVALLALNSCDLILAAAVRAAGGNPSATAQPFRLLAPDPEAGDGFGTAVAIGGDYAIVGASGEDAAGSDAGAAYVFHRTGNTWDSGVKLLSPDGEAFDSFGCCVSISGDYAIVGANRENAGGSQAGAAYIFHRVGANTWDGGIKVIAPSPNAYDWFGESVSIDGDYAVVGAYGVSQIGEMRGAAYVYHRTGVNTWDTGVEILAPDAEDGDAFGKSVAISGNYAIVGAYGDDNGVNISGAAYIYYRIGSNSWDGGTKVLAAQRNYYDEYGFSVAIKGDYAIMGGAYSEAAYVYHRMGENAWDAGTRIVDPYHRDTFGRAVSICGDYAIVGTGRALVYHRYSSNLWDSGIETDKPDSGAESVSLSSDLALVGAPSEDTAAVDAGAAYLIQIP